jgi:hypothetical protein
LGFFISSLFRHLSLAGYVRGGIFERKAFALVMGSSRKVTPSGMKADLCDDDSLEYQYAEQEDDVRHLKKKEDRTASV